MRRAFNFFGKPWWLASAAGTALALAPVAASAQPASLVTEHVRAELLAHAPRGVVPGQPVWVGLSLQHQPQWHTYWKNPGDSGLPTQLSWQLSAGAAAGQIAWPSPHALRVGPLINYGYEGAVLLPVPVAIPAGFAGDELRVTLQADWLACKDICVPESGEFTLRIPARSATTAHGRAFDDALARVPREVPSVAARATIERRALRIEVDGLPAPWQGRALAFFPEIGGVFEPAAPIEQRWDVARWVARMPLSAQRSESPTTLHAVLRPPGDAAGARVTIAITGSWSTASVAGERAAAARRLADNARRVAGSTSIRSEP